VTRPRALILDYGEVLSHPMRPGAIDLMAGQFGVPPAVMSGVYWRHRRDYDLGLTARDYWDLVARDLGSSLDDGMAESLITVDVDAWTDYRDEMWALAATFRAGGGRLGMLSNGVREIVARIRGDHDLPALFDAVVVSYEVQLAKPEPEIYRVALDLLGVAPGEALFVDDRQENIDTARELGMGTLRFTGDVHALRAMTLV
jgi:putative hydrolase of the HAD superfamily